VKIFKLIIICVFASCHLFGQEKSEIEKSTNDFDHFIGLSANGTGDFGAVYQLSYRLFYKRLGANLTVYPFLSDYLNEYNVGLTFLYEFYKGEKIALLIFQNNHYYKSDEDVTQYFHPNGYFNNGFGGELDFIIKTDFRINLMLGGSYFQNFDNIVPFVGLGFHYKL
jgi:hypothetical protein